MPKAINKEGVFSDTLIGWVFAAIGLAAAFLLDTKEQPQKWHAAIMWTGCAIGGVLIVSRARWILWRFWLAWIICLMVHIFFMWFIFEEALSRVRLGTLYVIPPAFIELLFLSLIVIPKIERFLGGTLRQKRKSVSHP